MPIEFKIKINMSSIQEKLFVENELSKLRIKQIPNAYCFGHFTTNENLKGHAVFTRAF